MSTSILKTHYRRSATILTPEQIEEIRYLKNKVPVYIIVKEKVQSISSVPPSENSPQGKENNHSPISGSLKSLDESISREISCPSMTPSFLESIETDGSPLDRVHEKQKKKKKSSRPKPVQSSNLPEISTEGSYQNSLLDVSYDLIVSIEKNNIEAEEAIHESEKCLARNSSFSPVYSSKVLH
ncbi:hypothetical protein RCL_jg14076.t1 [Rhizophagus clarus]|uniref:Uncharacterized protein n=1 Tax=Rhizophagus clarus TaxID=94130 RepID=A0A8H3QYS3_9GLOM|nr:hypothetical protein RCL_jg14076.t1 [Rhizophagus clarus]